MAERGFDWPGLFRMGVARIGLRPDDFWRLTPTEFATLAGLGDGGGRALGRDGFERLAARFPDGKDRDE